MDGLYISPLIILSFSMTDRWRENDRLTKLKLLLSDIMYKTLPDLNCMLVLSDSFYQPLFSTELYSRFHEVPYFKVTAEFKLRISYILSPLGYVCYNSTPQTVTDNKNICQLMISRLRKIIRGKLLDSHPFYR